MLIIKIVNDGTGDVKTGNYVYVVSTQDEVIETGKLFGHKRKEGWRGLLLNLVDQSSKSELEALIFKEEK